MLAVAACELLPVADAGGVGRPLPALSIAVVCLRHRTGLRRAAEPGYRPGNLHRHRARHLASLHDDTKPGSWFFGIAHQKCVQNWRKSGREGLLDANFAEALPGADDDPSELLIREEQEAEFMEWLNQLPPPQRAALLLNFVEDFSLEEIAGITGVSLGPVKSRLNYGKKALQKLLEDRNT